MKKDIFDIQFFLASSELEVVLKFFPHKLYDSYKNFLVGEKEDILAAGKIASTPVEYHGEIYFIVESLAEDASSINQFIQNKIEQYLDFIKKFHDYDYSKTITRDFLGFLFASEKNDIPSAIHLIQLLKLIRIKMLVQSCHLFLIKDHIKITPWLGIMDDGKEYKPDDMNHHDFACATFTASCKEIFFSNSPKDNKIYQASRIDGTKTPHNFLYVPIINKGNVLGILELKNFLSGEITDKEIIFAHSCAQIIGQFMIEHVSGLNIKQSEKTSTGLEKYISSNIVEKIRKKEIKNNELSGVKKEIVVLFAKVNQFAEMSDQVSASSLVDLLNYHFEVMGNIIIKHGGTIDKIMGHVIMAVWNHPEVQENALELSLQAAIEMQMAADSQIAKVWQDRGAINYGLGIGINRGQAVAGHFGAKQFMDFTVIGDTINLAQRLESIAADGEIWIPTDVVIAEKNLKMKPNKIEKGIKIKGKNQLIDAFIYSPVLKDHKRMK